MKGIAEAHLLDVTGFERPTIELAPGLALLRIVGGVGFGHFGGLRGVYLLEQAASQHGGALIGLRRGQVAGLAGGGLL
jgi:hypothetical protein